VVIICVVVEAGELGRKKVTICLWKHQAIILLLSLLLLVVVANGLALETFL
jgi:hypothetical protein